MPHTVVATACGRPAAECPSHVDPTALLVFAPGGSVVAVSGGGGLTGALWGSDTADVDDRVGVAVVSETERSRALIRLRNRYATDELTVEEFSQALDALLAAHTQAELERASPAVATPHAVSDVGLSDIESLERHLPAGERVVWTGHPSAGLAASNPRTMARVKFVSVWVVIVFLSNVAIGVSGGGLGFATVILLAWTYVIWSRYAFTPRSRRRTLYLLTTVRIARIVRNRKGEQMDSILLSAVPEISARTTKRGTGTITFRARAPASLFRPQPLAQGPDEEPITFMNVPDAAHVAQLISAVQTYEAD